MFGIHIKNSNVDELLEMINKFKNKNSLFQFFFIDPKKIQIKKHPSKDDIKLKKIDKLNIINHIGYMISPWNKENPKYKFMKLSLENQLNICVLKQLSISFRGGISGRRDSANQKN